MRNEKISNRQLWFILFIMRSTIVLAFLPVLTSTDVQQDAWISSLLTIVGSEVFLFLISYLDTRFPDLTLIEYSQKLLGILPGKFLGLVFLWLFLQASVVNIRMYGEMIITSFLPNTPLIFVISAMVMAATLCIYEGIEILGRMADVIFILFLGMLVTVFLIPLKNIDFKNLQPVMVKGWIPVIRGSLVPIALVSQTWILGMLTPVTTQPKKTVRVVMTSVGMSLIILIVVVIVTISVLGASEAARVNFPMLSLIRSVQVSQFLQRTEVLIVFSWGFGLFISVSTFLYGGAKGLSQLLSLGDYHAILLPMAVIWVFLATYGFENIFALFDFLKLNTYAPYGFALLIIPLIVLWSAYGIKTIITKIKGEF